MDIGYRLEDISLQIWEGVDRVWIKLYKTKWGTPWSHEAWIDLCENETTQVFIQSIIGSKDELGSQAKEIEEKIEEILNQVEELEEYRKLVNEIEECSYGYDIDIYPKDEDSITLNISIKTSNWRCIPSFKTIENLIHKIYNITGLETLIKERFL